MSTYRASSPRYNLVSEIGRGAFSVVLSATDKETGKKVAIKRISHVFDDPVFSKHVLREVKMLRHLKHPNLINCLDILLEPTCHSSAAAKWIPDPRNPCIPLGVVSPDQRIYFVSEMMDTDLHAVIQSPQPLSLKHLQYFLYQILQAVAYLHRAHILHRDLKPENILVNKDCHLKVCDLGLARLDKHAHFASFLASWSPFGSSPSPKSTNSTTSSVPDQLRRPSDIQRSAAGDPMTADSMTTDDNEDEAASAPSSRPSPTRDDKMQAEQTKPPGRPRACSLLSLDDYSMTERVVTRWYRAPEVILSMGKYTNALDVWSVACIFAELSLRRPLFPGKDFMEQLHLVCQVLGKPTEHEIAFFESPRAREFLRALPECKPVPLQTLFTNLDTNALDLMSKMLVFDPRRRITAEEALRHPFFASLYRPDDCLRAPPLQVMQQAFEFEQMPKLDLAYLRDSILKDICDFQRIKNGAPANDARPPTANAVASTNRGVLPANEGEVASMQCDNTPLMPPRTGLLAARKAALVEGTDAVDGKEACARVSSQAMNFASSTNSSLAQQPQHSGTAAMDVDGNQPMDTTAATADHVMAAPAMPGAPGFASQHAMHSRAQSAMAQLAQAAQPIRMA